MACCLLPLPKSCCLLPLPKSKLTYHQQNPATLIRENFLKIYSHQSLNLVRKVVIFLTRPAVNIAVNKIDIWRVRCHLSRVHFTIVRSLWCHRQSSVTPSANVKPASETRWWCVKVLVFMYVLLCRTRFYVCTLVTNFLCAHSSVILVFISFLLRNSGREINTKITFSWAHKQFATQVHTFFYIYLIQISKGQWPDYSSSDDERLHAGSPLILLISCYHFCAWSNANQFRIKL